MPEHHPEPADSPLESAHLAHPPDEAVPPEPPTKPRPPERKKLLLRLDPSIYDAVAGWATDDLRSINAQIEYALRLALKQAGRTPRKNNARDTQ